MTMETTSNPGAHTMPEDSMTVTLPAVPDRGPESVAPVPFLKGAFSLYTTPDGGYHLACRLDGEDEDRHFPVPAMLVKMAEMRTGGGLLARFTGRKG